MSSSEKACKDPNKIETTLNVNFCINGVLYQISISNNSNMCSSDIVSYCGRYITNPEMYQYIILKHFKALKVIVYTCTYITKTIMIKENIQ